MNNHMQMTLSDGISSFELNDPSASIYLNPDIEGLTGLPDIRESSGSNAGADGGWTSAQFYEPRLIIINGVIANNDVAVVEQRRRELATILSHKELTLSFVTEAGNKYSCEVRVTGFTTSIQSPLCAAYWKINLRADDPLIYDNAEGDLIATLEAQRSVGGFEINFNLPVLISGGSSFVAVDNNGTSDVSPLIVLHGPLHSPSIINQSTNQQLDLSVDIGAGDEVLIDTKFMTATLNGENIFDSVSGDYITLMPGSNRCMLISASASDDGYAQIRYKGGYLGI